MDLSFGTKLLGCKWISKRKYNVDGTINNYKTRLVAKRLKKKKDIDFFNTYSPVTKITTILLISIATLHELEIHQMDIKITFLNSELKEEIYME